MLVILLLFIAIGILVASNLERLINKIKDFADEIEIKPLMKDQSRSVY